MPMSLAFGRNRQQNAGKSSSYGGGSSCSPQKTNGKHEAKLMIHEIQEGPPLIIWLSMQCPATPVVNDLFSRLPSAQCKFSNTLKMWLFTFDLYDRIVTEFFTPPFESIHLVELPRSLAKGLANFQKRISKLNCDREPILNLNAPVLAWLLPFQLEAVKFVVRRGGRAMLGDEMGCGKTLQAIAVMLHYRKFWPVLIVVPSSLMKQWPDEIRKYAGDLVGDGDIRIVGKSSDVGTALITIITYKVMDNLVASKLLTPDQFGVVVADESHNLKNKDSSRSLAVIPFLRKATVALCMTGTPEVNRPVELYSQLNGILPDVFNDYNDFVRRYCDAKPNKSLPGLNVSGHSNDKELNTLLCGLVMVRRSKEEVLTELPEKRRELRYVEPDPVCLPEIKRITHRSKQLEDMIASGAGKDPAEIQAWSNEKQQLLTALYMVTGTSKIPSIKEELVKLVEESRAERGLIAAKRLSDAAAAKAVAQQAVLHTQEDSSAEDDEVEEAGAGEEKGSGTASDHSDGDQVLAASDCEYVPSSKALRILSSSGGSADSKRKGVAAKSAPAPVIMELEDDIITSHVHDLCDTDEEPAPHSKRLKTNSGAVGSGKGGYWEDDEGCDYNLNDIKSGALGSSKRGGSKSRSGGGNGGAADDSDDEVYGLFDQRVKNAAKNKAKAGAAKSATAASKSAAKESKPKSDDGSSVEDTAACGVGQKIIVFFHHKMVLQAIEDALTALQVKFIKIDGATPQTKRAKLIDQFQNDNVTDVALLSITACGVGLNLTRANVALFGELNWSLGVVLQAEDRIHRLGQTAKEVRIIYMIARNTVDEIVWEQIQRKHQVVGATVGTSGARSYSGGMKINSDRQDSGSGKQQDLHASYAAAAAKKAEEQEVLAAMAAYANRSTATSTATSTASAPAATALPVSTSHSFSAMPVTVVPSVVPAAIGTNAGPSGAVSGYHPQGPIAAPQGSYGAPNVSSSRPASYSSTVPAVGALQNPPEYGMQFGSSSSSLPQAGLSSSSASVPLNVPNMHMRAASYPVNPLSASIIPASSASYGAVAQEAACTPRDMQGRPVVPSGVPLFGHTEEFAYSAASQASEATSGESRGSDNHPTRPGAPQPSISSAPATQATVQRAQPVVLPVQQASYMPAGAGQGSNPAPPARALDLAVPPASAASTASAAPAPPAVPSSSFPAAPNKAPLPPEMLARMEANRLAAQAKLAKRREEMQQGLLQGQGQGALSGAPVQAAPALLLPTAPQTPVLPVPPAVGHASPLKPLQTAQTFPAHSFAGSPALGAALQSRQPAANLPPGAISTAPVPSAPAHVFSTGRGSTLAISEAQIRQANSMLAGAAPVAPPMAPASITRVGGVIVATPSYPIPASAAARSIIPAPVSVPSMQPPAVAPANFAPSHSTGPAQASAQTAPNAQGFTSATLYFDGGALGNPGKAGAGYQLFANNGRTIKENAVKMTGVCTNNQAEYVGLIHGMTAALHCGVQELLVYGDSEVVIKQMTGLYQVKNPTLQGMHQRAQSLRSRFRRIQLQWIPREKNSGADALSKQAMHHPEQAAEVADWFVSSA